MRTRVRRNTGPMVLLIPEPGLTETPVSSPVRKKSRAVLARSRPCVSLICTTDNRTDGEVSRGVVMVLVCTDIYRGSLCRSLQIIARPPKRGDEPPVSLSRFQRFAFH